MCRTARNQGLPHPARSECNVGVPTLDLTDLVDRRAELLATSRDADAGAELDPRLAELTDSLRDALAGRDAQVRRVRLDEPGDLVERLADAEPVHPFAGPEDLADRLDDDRRCFVLEHPLLPGRPLNVVWVALCQGIPDDLSAILDPVAPTADPRTADTAAFYSIWNVEPGLVGLPGGRSLLGGVVDALRAELPGLGTFVTLSPIPGFRTWWTDSRRAEVSSAAAPSRDELLRSCADYLTTFESPGRLLDPVARFHMGNGARLLRVVPDADRSERGMQRSWGAMANYRYEPEDRPANVRSLERDRPAVGSQVDELLTTEM
jgi:malonyl-CoA decarboxylase